MSFWQGFMYIFAAIFGHFCCCSNAENFHFGVLIPTTGKFPIGRTSVSAAAIAVDKVNSDPTLTMLRKFNHSFTYTWADTQCDPVVGLKQIVDIWKKNITHAFIGPVCDDICEPGAYLANAWQIPMISFGCVSPILSDKKKFPTFARTLPPSSGLQNVIYALSQRFNWTRVAIVPSDDAMWTRTAVDIKQDLEQAGIEVVYVNMFDSLKNEHRTTFNKTHTEILNATKQEARVFFLICFPDEVRDFMLHAEELQMMNGLYAFFTLDMTVRNRDDTDDVRAKKSMEGTIDITIFEPRKVGKYAEFVAEIKRRIYEPPFSMTFPPGERTGVHAMLLYEAIILFAVALNATIAEGGSFKNGSHISRNMFNRTFTGLEQQVAIDENGNRFPNYLLKNYVNGFYTDVGVHNVSANRGVRLVISDNLIIWPGGGRKVPTGHPPCGWRGQLCGEKIDKGLMNTVVSISVVAVLVVACSIAFTVVTRNRRKALHSMDWKIPWMDIRVDEGVKDMISSGSTVTKATKSQSSLMKVQDYGGNLSLSSGSTNHADCLSKSSGSTLRQMFAPVGICNGQLVALRKVQKPYVHVTDNIIYEMNLVPLRSLAHPNLNTFLGACLDDPERICLVSVYCSKGSLQDVLENENIKIDFTFQVSFMNDIVNGMLFIQGTEFKAHGSLRSSNVLVDTRWICKISGFGLDSFLAGEREDGGEDIIFFKKMWTAPELLRQSGNYKKEDLLKGDAYSFGIIMHEILERNGPFGSPSMRPKDIIERVKYGENPPFRPLIQNADQNEKLVEMMRLCWQENPFDRLLFSGVREKLKEITKGKKMNIVDQMISMMEKYANHLEEVVEERTTKLAEEQKKTEELLCRMLPRQVALELRQGRVISPESFSHVTVMFSDIVGFTALSSESSPVQVVEFLNDLYTCFDRIIENLDVYKVETIGDAYMCVSGLPIRNGKNHVGEIATLCLEFLSAVTTFKIRHRPGRQLQLRIGMHTGPVAAGVVGVKMPRYCLFGDTVNYASRMESTGLALRIHVSPEARDALHELGGYDLIERGTIKIKGKGMTTTYFLINKQGFNKIMPDLSRAAEFEDDLHAG